MKIKLLKGLSLISALTILVSACGKSDSNEATGNRQQATVDSSRATNLVFNGDFEQGVGTPDGWTTKNQFLNDVTGWDTEITHNSTHSLKIENIGGTDAYWKGSPVVLKEPASAFEASIWTIAKDIKTPTGTFALAFDVYFKDADGKEVKKRVSIDLSQTSQVWDETKGKMLFTENIIKIVPIICFSGNIGAVYIDDLSVYTQNIDFNKGKVLFDSNEKNSAFTINPRTMNHELPSANNSSVVCEVTGSQTIYSANFIPVEPDKIYKLSGMFKSSGKNESTFYFGLDPYDKDKKLIRYSYYGYINNTETVLARSCSRTDTVIYVKDAHLWKMEKYATVAFNIDDSGKYEDIPNFNISSYIKDISKYDSYWKIELSNPCGFDFSVGTKIREHRDSASYIPAGGEKNLSKSWNEYSGKFLGSSDFYGVNKLPKTTQYVKIIILCNPGQSKESILQFKDVKLDESSY